MTEAIVGVQKYISLGLEGYETGVYPRMVLRRSDDTVLPESPIDFTAVGSDGQYSALWTPSEPGDISGYVVVYEDAAHLIRSNRFHPLPAAFRVWTRDQDEQFLRLLAHHGENVRDVVHSYSGSDPQSATRYIYEDEADAANDVNRKGEIDVQATFGPLPNTLVRRKIS